MFMLLAGLLIFDFRIQDLCVSSLTTLPSFTSVSRVIVWPLAGFCSSLEVMTLLVIDALVDGSCGFWGSLVIDLNILLLIA